MISQVVITINIDFKILALILIGELFCIVIGIGNNTH